MVIYCRWIISYRSTQLIGYNPSFFGAYSLTVEHVAHNDAVVGSNPAKPNNEAIIKSK